MKDLELVSTADHYDRLRNFCLFCVLTAVLKHLGWMIGSDQVLAL